ncbi:group XIIA secretory phospholipase A2 [Diorhabda carinulata]|uniref:group XIIA secretory phospholipase A2 n=1 Tax=Diorhabda carinulata TaxID=1163345 RepID=UPI0025A1FD81|nr:group XIIA secretory phospholipase A2 [Diorhabda carinulata]
MDVPYGKLLVYFLTFLGYIYSGYGSGFLSNLREAVITAETVFGEVFKNVINVANRFREVNDIFDAAVEEECIFKCPNNEEPKPNRYHSPTADGCGSLGLTIPTEYLPIGEMKKCCETHDICYDTCRKDKEVCDVEFKRCLYKYCESYDKVLGGSTTVKACKGAAKMLFTGTLTLGCKSYLNAQSKACYCPSTGREDKRKKYSGGNSEL